MKVFYLLLLIGSVLTSTDYDSWGYKLYDIYYNTDYTVDINQFPEGYLPANFQYYFRLKVEENNSMEIQLKVIKRAVIHFDIRVCFYQTLPSDQQIYSGHSGCFLLVPKLDHTDGDVDVYLFDFETMIGINYLGVLVRNYFALDYLNVYIHSALPKDNEGWYYKLYDIYYNTDYTVDTTQFTEGYLPANFKYYFRLQVEEDDKMQIQLKVIKRAVIQFGVRVCAYQIKPSDDEIYSGHNSCTLLEPKLDHTDGNTDVYLFDFETQTGVNYLGVLVKNYNSLDYLNVYIYSTKGSYVALILILIFLPCIIIAAIVIFCLRRYGVISFGVSSNKI